MLNHITIMGRLTRDPELRRTGSGVAVTSFTLAVDRDYKADNAERETDFIDCVAWRNIGEFAAKHFTKGRMAVVSGRLEIRNWTDRDGNKRRSAEVNVENMYFADSKREEQNGSQQNYGAPQGNYGAPAGSYGQQNYGAPAASNGGYPNQGYAPQYGGSYAAPPAPSSDYAILDGDDAQMPF